MPITITQTPDMPDGAVRIAAPTAPEGAEMRITRLDKGAPRYLDPRQTGDAAWGAADVWFRPEADSNGAMMLGPEVTWHLKPHMPYAVSYRGSDGVIIEDRMVWKALRLPSTAPPPSRAGGVDLKRAPEPEPDTTLEDDLAAFAEAPDAAPTNSASTAPPVAPTPDARARNAGEGKAKIWIFALVLLLLIAAAGYYAAFVNPGFLNEEDAAAVVSEDPAEPVAGADAPNPLTLEWAREFLQTNPDAAAAAAEAERFAGAGEDSAAFLIRRYAARQGDAASAAILGDMYAPETWSKGVIQAPDAAQALSYYEQAGAKGDADALEKAIALVESGAAAVSDKNAKLAELNDALAKAKDNQ